MPPPPPQQQLPEDLIFCGILPLLPVRSLARSAAVCKAWRDLILRDAAFAALQARSPSPASSALARFHNGRLEFLLSPGPQPLVPGRRRRQRPPLPAARALRVHRRPPLPDGAPGRDQAARLVRLQPGDAPRRPQDPVRLPALRRRARLRPGGGAGGLRRGRRRQGGVGGVPVLLVLLPRRGFRVAHDGAARHPRSASRRTRRSSPEAGGRVHWLTSRGNIVWHDAAAVRSGVIPPPPRAEAGNADLAAWRGRLRLACATPGGIGVWELAGYGGESGGGAVGGRALEELGRGRRRDGAGAVLPVVGGAGGEEALGLALRYAYKHPARTAAAGGEEEEEAAANEKKRDRWLRALVRYERGTGATAVAAELAGKEIHDGLGTVVGYHSSLAALPELNWDA
ncbi:unnamed protein product [Urochloa humidicola]